MIDSLTARGARLVAAVLLATLAGGAQRLVAQQGTTGGVRAVTLDEAINLALQTQPAIIQAEGNLDVAHASQREALGAYLPSLSLSSGLSQNSPNRWNSQTQQYITGQKSVSYSTGLSASLTIFDGFSRLAQTRAANASAASTDAALTNQKFQVILQTKQAFFNSLAAGDLVSAAQTQLERAQRRLEVSKDRLAAGSGIRSDALGGPVDVGNAELALLNARAQQATAEANLARLIGVTGAVHASGQPALPDLSALDTAALRQEAIDLVMETVADLFKERGEEEKVWGSMVKQALKRRNPGFNESYYGFRAFSDLLEEAQKRKLLSLERDEKSGGYLIRPMWRPPGAPRARGASRTSTAELRAAPRAPARKAPAR